MTPASGLRATLAACALSAGLVQAEDFHRCNRMQWGGLDLHIDGDRNMSRSAQGDGGPDTAYWDTASQSAVNKAWRGFWDLDRTNPRIAVYASGTRAEGFNTLPDSVNVVHKHANMAGTGPSRIMWWPAVVAPIITEFDVELRGRTALVNPPVGPTGVPPIGATTTCGHNMQTMAGSFLHELGHGYGYDHWLDWVSIMNPGHREPLSCERPVSASGVMDVTPDALATQCHDIAYGLGTGVDFSGTPVRQTCSLANGSGCSSALSTITRLPLDSSFALVLATFTSFSNRDSFSGDVEYRLLLSKDANVHTYDREVGRGTLSGWDRGATVTRVLGGRMNPALDLPEAGVFYRLLIQLDPGNDVDETNETNNVIDTAQLFFRL